MDDANDFASRMADTTLGSLLVANSWLSATID